MSVFLLNIQIILQQSHMHHLYILVHGWLKYTCEERSNWIQVL